MKKMMKMVSMFLALVLVLGCLTACSSAGEKKEASASDADKDVMLGLIGPMTGDYANYGTSVKNGAQIAVDEINAAGGVNGWTFSLNTQDSQGDPDSAVSAYGKLMDDGMDTSIGCVLSGEAQSVITAAKADNILIVTPSSSAKDCIAGNEKAFRVCFNDPAQGAASANYIADNNLATKVAVFYQSDIDYSAGLYETFKAQAAERGVEIVCEQTFTDGSKADFSTQINAIRDSDAELVFMPFYAAEASTFLTQAKGKLDGMTFFGCDGMDGIQTKVSDMSLIEGLMMLTPFAADADDEQTKAFVAEYAKRFNNAIPDQFAADGYDAVYTVKAVMEKTGKTPADADFTEALVKAMYEVEVDGLTGAMTWDEEREPNKAAKAMVFQNGVAVLAE